MRILSACTGAKPMWWAVALAAAALSGACGTYTPSGISQMSAADICEMEYMQGRNLSAQARQTMQGELAKRNDNCRNHTAEVERRYAEFMWQLTYGGQDEP